MKKYIIGFWICFISVLSQGQINGIVSDDKGEQLAYATVYIEGTSIGVSTNSEGYYELHPNQKGRLSIVCQYLGYETKIQAALYKGGKQTLNITLNQESILAPTIVINANAEDPAYAIIRQAIKKRKYYQEKLESLSFKSYIKGRFDVEKVPPFMLKVMIDGNDMFDVDSTGKGIVYLSESESTFYKTKPDKVREIMHSSLISGFDNQFSFNNAMSMNFSIYDNHLELMRDIISPISNNALLYYKYKLLGTTYDEKGRVLNKIELIPKSKVSPTFSGIIYVINDIWSVPQGELILNTDHAGEPLIDSVRLVYSAVEVEEDTWVDIQKNMWMRMKAFGFAASGGFNGVFHDFEINPDYADDFFNREFFKVEEGANTKSDAYWDSIRPMPLTELEAINYVAMDSLAVVRKAKMDSIVNNPPKFKLNDIWSGYSRYFDKGRYKMNYLPLDQGGFNVVQGYFAGISSRIFTNPDSFHKPAWEMEGNLDYGFSEKQLRGSGYYSRSTNTPNNFRWTIEAGRFIQQYREVAPLHSFANTVYSLLQEKNYAKFIEQDAVGIEIEKEWLTGISLRAFTEFSRRRALINNTDYSWAKAKFEYASNTPLKPRIVVNELPAFDANSHIVLGFQADIVFGQKYVSLPNRTFKMGSKYPVVHLAAVFDHNLERERHFAHLQVGLSDNYEWNVAGDGRWNVYAGAFVLDKPSYFLDYKHFDGNQTIFGAPDRYNRSFHLLPYYEHSTNDYYVEGHLEHHFNGFILDKIPLVKLLKWNLVTGANYLFTPERKMYSEVNVGIENIGVSFFRFLRVDAIFNFDENGFRKADYIIGINVLSFGDFGGNERKRIKTKF